MSRKINKKHRKKSITQEAYGSMIQWKKFQRGR